MLVVIGFAHMLYQYTAAKWEERLCVDSFKLTNGVDTECEPPTLLRDSYYSTPPLLILNPTTLLQDELYLRNNTYQMVLIFIFAVLSGPAPSAQRSYCGDCHLLL